MDKTESHESSLESLDSQLAAETLAKICFLSTDEDPILAKAICDRLNAPLSEMRVDYFSNGEARPIINPSVHGKKIFLIATLAPIVRSPLYDLKGTNIRSVNDQLIALILTIGALNRAGAKSLTLILPSYPYARQDKKDEPHAAISASHIAKLLTVSGINKLICLDLHAAAIQGFFPESVPVDNLYAIAPVIEHLQNHVFTNPKYLLKKGPDVNPIDNFIAVSPDEGAFKRTRKYAEGLGIPYLCLTKTRDYSRKNYVDESKTQIFGAVTELANRVAIIFDDMCDTFGTIQAAAKKLVEAGAVSVIVVVSHGILSGPAIERLNKTDEVVELICSDSLPQQLNKKLTSKLSTFSIAPLLAEVIRRRLNKESVSEIFYHT
jgi:ribose-phosphate pyrophosphokinase